MSDIIRPKRKRLSRHDKQAPPPARRNKQRVSRRRRKKGSWFWKLIFRLFLLVIILSAGPMIALRFIDPPTSSFIELNKLSNNRNIKHQWLDMEDVSLYFPNAVIAAEDQQFPNHFGFDLKQIKLVIEQLRNCLLYTSPSPRDLSTSRMPSSA